MTVEKKENQAEIAPNEEDFSSELDEPRWSVVSFERCEASSLTFVQAEQKMKELEAANIVGLCVVTDEVAARIGKN